MYWKKEASESDREEEHPLLVQCKLFIKEQLFIATAQRFSQFHTHSSPCRNRAYTPGQLCHALSCHIISHTQSLCFHNSYGFRGIFLIFGGDLPSSLLHNQGIVELPVVRGKQTCLNSQKDELFIQCEEHLAACSLMHTDNRQGHCPCASWACPNYDSKF